MRSRALDAVVTSFVDDISDALVVATGRLGDVDADELRTAATVEAFNLSVAMIDADERHTYDELDGLIDAFGHRLPDTQLLRATPETIRDSSLVAGHRAWLEEDSELFGILTDADRRDGTDLAVRYYERALDVAHVIASLDVVPARAELEAISRLRSRLLTGLRHRPGAHGTDGDIRDRDRQAPGGTGAGAGDDRGRADRGDAAGGGSGEADPADDRPPDPPPRPLEDLLSELDELIGLDDVKARVHLVADFLYVQRLRSERGLRTLETSHHLVFTGNPGTGKTTVARLLAQIYRTLGVVERGHLVETDRSGMVAGFVGQTAPLVTARFDEADEGMLFIDEAYTLARGNENDFGREAIDQIVKLMEDRRDRVVLVVAGYPEEMEAFLSSNPGLRSRFPTVIDFPDYSNDELLRIVDIIGRKQQYELDVSGRAAFERALEAVPRTKGFGNARVARNLFEATVNRHASRMRHLEEHSDEDLTTLTAEDVPDHADPG